jgi:hypothetical protein
LEGFGFGKKLNRTPLKGKPACQKEPAADRLTKQSGSSDAAWVESLFSCTMI